MKVVSTIRLVNLSSLTPTTAGELWFDDNVAQNTLAFYDGTNTQHVISKNLLASTTAAEGASLVGVEQTLTALTGTDVQAVLENIDSKISLLETGLNWEEQVLGIENDPPGSPSAGDRYIVGDTPTGDFTGEAGSIAVYNGATWDFTSFVTADEGTAVYVQSLDTSYVLTAALLWVPFASIVTHNNLSSLQGGTASEYYHLTQAYFNLVTALDSADDSEGASLIKVATSASLGSFTGNGVAGSVQAVLESLATVNSTASGEGASLIGVFNTPLTGWLTGVTTVQGALEVIDTLSTTSNGEGASLIGVEDSAGYFTATDVEAVLAEIYAGTLKAYRSTSTAFTSGQTIAFAHNRANRQVSVTVQKDSGGAAGEHVLADVVPTTGSETNSIDVTIDEAGNYFITVIG